MYWLKSVWLTGVIDFNTATLTAAFGSGMTMSTVNVSVIPDTILEGPEQFNLTLNVLSSLGPSITAGGRNTAVGVITDSTSKCGKYTVKGDISIV